jgi:hypothetical protein
MSVETDFVAVESNLDRVRNKLLALDLAQVRRFCLSVPYAVSATTQVARAFAEDRPLFVATFRPEALNPDDFDDLPARAGALWYCDAMLRQAIDPKGALAKELLTAKPLRAKLLRAATYLWEDDEELGPVVADIRAGSGHVDTADDLVRLAVLFSDQMQACHSRCDVTLADVEAARSLGARMLSAWRKNSTQKTTELREMRDRAGEYLMRGVDHIRAAAQFIFRNDEAAFSRYPSLYLRTPAQPRRDAATAADETDGAVDA